MFDDMIVYLDQHINFNQDLLDVGNSRLNDKDIDLVSLFSVLDVINKNILMLKNIKNSLLICKDSLCDSKK